VKFAINKIFKRKIYHHSRAPITWTICIQRQAFYGMSHPLAPFFFFNTAAQYRQSLPSHPPVLPVGTMGSHLAQPASEGAFGRMKGQGFFISAQGRMGQWEANPPSTARDALKGFPIKAIGIIKREGRYGCGINGF